MAMMKKKEVSAPPANYVQFSSTVTYRVFESNSPTKCSHICPQDDDTYSSPLGLTQADSASESMGRTREAIPHDRRVQQRISIAAVLSFQNHLRRLSNDPSTHPDLLCSVSSKFSQRARDLASEHGRQLFCEVHQPAKGSAMTIPLHVSKFPALKRKSDASRHMESSGRPEQKKRRCVSHCRVE
mmetsp:Transcript_19693/g.32310  ORF Transcript_19693/g.32310 Transcript_19693/m.32310 type:complete len:184 (-) Transcript_19693:37-588(-)